MRVLMLEARARDDVAARRERRDHGIIRVALLALVGDDAFGLAIIVARAEAGRLIGVEAVAIDRIGNDWRNAALLQCRAACAPDVEILAAMAGRGVDEAGAGVIRDVIAIQKRHGKFITSA